MVARSTRRAAAVVLAAAPFALPACIDGAAAGRVDATAGRVEAPPAVATLPGAAPVGQWVWTDADRPVLAAARRSHPDLVAGVHVATVTFADGRFADTLGLPPTTAGPVAVVIRLDDSVNAAWDADPELRGLDAALGRVVTLVRARPVRPVEMQLDYDVPVRHLRAWAAVLARLRQTTLAGTPLWVTSLVAHLRDPAFGDAMRGVVDGHVLQLFDTGDDPLAAAEVATLTARAGLPFRVGLGAFDRAGAPPNTAWFAHAGEVCAATCGGLWIFPAGRAWIDRFAAADPANPTPPALLSHPGTAP